MAGREYMGLAKLYAEILDAVTDEARVRFSCSEYDSILLEGQATELVPPPDASLDKLNGRAAEVRTFGWKFIPGPDGTSDIDYPLLDVMRWTFRRAWSGSGSIRFSSPTTAEAPFSSGALQALRRLPMDGQVRAFHGEGEVVIDRTVARRLSAVHESQP